MATHSSILAERILWMKEPGGLQSKGSQRVRPDGATKEKQQESSPGSPRWLLLTETLDAEDDIWGEREAKASFMSG